jgi:ATP-dependent protease ClpP protease subunit
MSAVIFTAADTRLLMPDTTFMVHNVLFSTSETPTQGLRSNWKLLTEQEQTMLNIFAEKCINGPFFKQRGYTLSKIKTYIRGRITQNIDWYMGAEEALNLGFCDGIIGSKEFPSIDQLKKS